ncbi:MAG: zf-TFIIB domain-containing protein, partial [Planctomycetota bacterium]
MKCPKCRDVELEQIEKHGIELDRCPTCGGMWFDQGEVDELEDQRLDVDEVKGTMVVMEKESDFACPHCGETLNQFDYRYYGLTLEYCPAGHGYWLD